MSCADVACWVNVCSVAVLGCVIKSATRPVCPSKVRLLWYPSAASSPRLASVKSTAGILCRADVMVLLDVVMVYNPLLQNFTHPISLLYPNQVLSGLLE